MKTAWLELFACAGGALILSGTARGAFTGITVAGVSNPFGLTTCRVFAEFSDSADRLVAAGGTPGSALAIGVTGGTFYQHPFGDDLTPIGNLAIFPSLEFDTFVDIGLLPGNGPAVDNTLFVPGWPGFGVSALSTDASGWFVTPDQSQGAPDAEGRVLLGQFSTADGRGFTGQVLLQVISDGQPVQVHVRFCHPAGKAACVEGDLNGDNLVGVQDFLLLLETWGPCRGCPGDADGDGSIGIVDMLSLLANWTYLQVVPPADADLNRDGVVNIMDLFSLYSCAGPAVGKCVAADLNGDGFVGIDDFLLLLADWD